MLSAHFLIVEKRHFASKGLARTYRENAPLGHPERANKGEWKDLDRGKKPRARCVSTKLFVGQNVTLRLERVSCEHISESVTCTFGDSSGFFVEPLRMTKKASANTASISYNDP